MTGRRFRYPRSTRLRKAWQFDRLFRTGRRIRGELVRLLFIASPDGTTQAGVAVGRKQGNSPARNRGRRMLKEALRRIMPWTRDGYWIICTLRTSALERSARDIYNDTARIMQRAGLLQEDWPGPDWEADRRRSADDVHG